MTLGCKKKGSGSSFSINVSIRSLTILHFRKDQRSDLDQDLPIIDPNASKGSFKRYVTPNS